MAIDKQTILEHFRHRSGHGRGLHLHNVAYHLMRMILEEEDFDGMGNLLGFCEDADNLRPWLPSEVDRIIFSTGLSEGLRTVSAGRGVASGPVFAERQYAG